MGNWMTVAAGKPRPHSRYLVRRQVRGAITISTATPCYGMHEPWWVQLKMDGTNADPINMQDGDEWQPIAADAVQQ